MNRKTNKIYGVISIAVPVALMFAVLLFCRTAYKYDIGKIILFSICSALLFAVLNVFLHEIGHVIFGKANGFTLITLTIFFFKWTKTQKGTEFSLIGFNDCAGSTEMAVKSTENVNNKIINMTKGGIFFNAVLTLVCVVPFFMASVIPMWAYILWGIGLPISAYCLLSNALPQYVGNARNDGGVIFGLKHGDDESKVTVNLFKIESELLSGRTPAQIDKSLYFDLPQLPEDSLTYLSLLSARYFYHLDCKDYEGAKTVASRFISLYEYLPKGTINVLKTYLLYSYCTFDFDEEKADELMFELEKHLNNNNDALSVLTKLAYIFFVDGNKTAFDIFYKKGIKEAEKMKIKGLGAFYKDRLNQIN